MFFNRMESGRASISDAVYMEVITGLHGTTMPTILAAACQAMVGAITTYETGDIVTAGLTVAGVVVPLSACSRSSPSVAASRVRRSSVGPRPRAGSGAMLPALLQRRPCSACLPRAASCWVMRSVP
ncbi:hypothetical protein ABIF86_001376 [Bradyrhizobium japonicum]